MVKGDMLVENMKYLGRITSNPILEVRAHCGLFKQTWDMLTAA